MSLDFKKDMYTEQWKIMQPLKKSCFQRLFNDMWKWPYIMLSEKSEMQAVYTVSFQFW